MRWISSTVLAAGLLLATVLHAPPPGDAFAAGAATWFGGGVISPGTTMTPTHQTTFAFDGDVYTMDTMLPPTGPTLLYSGFAVLHCTFVGSSTIPETTVAGQGVGSLACNSPLGVQVVLPQGQIDLNASVSLSGATVSYTRIGYTVLLNGGCWLTIVAGGSASTQPVVVEAVVMMEPTSVNPVATYQFQGVMAALG